MTRLSIFFQFIVLICGLATAFGAASFPTTVTTAQGAATGGTFGNIRYWKNVPYARAPVGNLRFAAPVAPLPYADGAADFSGIEDNIACPQFGGDGPGQEDCLHLDIYAPDQPTESFPTGGFPVIVWIHGGAFIIGSKNGFVGTKLASEGAVVVSINYRLNVLGFLRTSDRRAGNWGFRDQQFALQWVKNNIAAFGGNPDMVTIAGQSAGANSVKLHLTSPSSANLFHRAITQSPMALSYYPEKEDAVASAQYLSTKLDCSWNDISCLRAKSADDLVAAFYYYLEDCKANAIDHYAYDLDRQFWSCGIAPQIEKNVIPNQMARAFRRGHVNRVPWIIGVAWNEALMDSDSVYNPLRTQGDRFYQNNGALMSTSQNEYIRYINEAVDRSDYFEDVLGTQQPITPRAQHIYEAYPYEFNENTTEIYPRLYNGVFGFSALDANYIWNSLYHDRMYFCAARNALHRLQLSNRKAYPNVFFYVFKQVPQEKKDLFYGSGEGQFNGDAKAAVEGNFWSNNLYPTHSDELGYVFPMPDYVWSESEDEMLSNRMVDSWYNFAVSGNPMAGPNSWMDVGYWTPYSAKNNLFTLLESPQRVRYGIQVGLREAQCDFWEIAGFTLANPPATATSTNAKKKHATSAALEQDNLTEEELVEVKGLGEKLSIEEVVMAQQKKAKKENKEQKKPSLRSN